MYLVSFSAEGWETWDVTRRPLIRDRMPVLIDDDLRFEDGPGASRTAVVAVNRWLRGLPLNGAPSERTWRNHAGSLREWMTFLRDRGVHPLGVGRICHRPSGSGKSTLLHVLAGVLVPDEGTVDYGHVRVTALGEAGRSRLRLSEFGFVFQYGQLLPDLSAVDNVTIPLLLAGTRRREALRQAGAWLERLGLAEHSRKLPAQLSGGQAQRVAVARALVTAPAVLFADEPTGSLDSLAAETLMLALTQAARAAATTVVLITHDPRTAAYADRELIVRDGQITVGGPYG